MCGILGFITNKPAEDNYTMLGDLLYVSSSRGTDATGVAVVSGTKTKVVKEDIPADKFITKHYKGMKKDISKAKVVLGHTRLATQGHQKENHNNHPIVSDHYIMVHNGTCSSMDRIKDYVYKGTVDSEILLSYVERKGLKDGLKALKGSAAVAIIKDDEPDVIYLWRHNNPLWLAYDKDREAIFFGSTDDILKEGLANELDFFSSFKMRQIAEDVLYKMTCNPLKVEAIMAIEPVGWTYYSGNKRWNNTTAAQRNQWDDYGAGYMYGMHQEYSGIKDDEPDEKIAAKEKGDGDGNKKEGKRDDAKYSSIYRSLVSCMWDRENKVFTTDKVASLPPDTKYYFTPASFDFTNWKRLEGGGHVSIDKKLVKFFDHTKKAHFVMTITDAIKEGLIDMSK